MWWNVRATQQNVLIIPCASRVGSVDENLADVTMRFLCFSLMFLCPAGVRFCVRQAEEFVSKCNCSVRGAESL